MVFRSNNKSTRRIHRLNDGMKRAIWITVGILLVLAFVFFWLAWTPAEPDEGPAPFRGLDGKLPPTAERR
jgi:hypothetical protein